MSLDQAIFKVHDVNKSFEVGSQRVPVLKHITFEVKSGDFMIIFGPSGCGKSTLLHTILGLEEPSSGWIHFLDKDIYESEFGKASSKDERAEFRKQYVGMVYQQSNWIKSLTVLENVAFPLSLTGMEKARRNQTATNMLETMEMINWANYIPAQLSSGQQQKVALARALITDPKVIIADEPTGNLDFDSGQELMKILTKLNKNGGKTVIMVTHDLEYLDFAHTAVRMFNGEIVGTYTGDGKKELFKTIDGKRGNGGKNV